MQINCDGTIHNPLGGASYVFEKEIIPYILETLHKNKLKISVGAQPNSSPHFGTLETMALAFALARKIEEYDSKKKVTILYEVIETAASELKRIKDMTIGTKYKEYQIKNVIINGDGADWTGSIVEVAKEIFQLDMAHVQKKMYMAISEEEYLKKMQEMVYTEQATDIFSLIYNF